MNNSAFSSFIRPSVDRFRLGISGVPLSSICGKLSRSSFVNTDLNCSFNAYAFPLLFSIVSPLTFSVGTNQNIKKMIRKKETLYKAAKRYQTEDHWKKFKQYRAQVKTEIDKAHRKFIFNKINFSWLVPDNLRSCIYSCYYHLMVTHSIHNIDFMYEIFVGS
jgi:hypothetical protein